MVTQKEQLPLKILVYIFAAVVGLLIASSAQAQCQTGMNEVLSNNACTKIRTYKSNDISEKPILLITLHGDSPFHNPSYHYKLARLVAEKSNNLVAIGMLRPGYTDAEDRVSDGIKGDAIGDNYDQSRVDQIAKAIQQLKAHYKSSKLILAGHSGGSAITANLIALYPGLVDHAFIVSCPCNINAWRKDMYKLTNKSIFDGDLEAISPIELVEHISNRTAVTLFVGKDDVVTNIALSNEYKSALEQAKINTTMHVVDGEHNIFLKGEIVDAITSVVGRYNNAKNFDR